MILSVVLLLVAMLITMLKLPENAQAYAFLTFLTPWTFGVIGVYIGVQGWIDKAKGNS